MHVVAIEPAPVACCAPVPGTLNTVAVGATVPEQRKPGSVAGIVPAVPVHMPLGGRAQPPPDAVNGK